MRELNAEQKSTCESNSDTCKPCKFTNCNAKNFQVCAICNSKHDIDCSGNATLKEFVCEDYDAERCFEGIDAEGYTQRFCGTELDYKRNNYPPQQLRVCNHNNCNMNIFPENRLKCYRCNGEDECNYIDSRRANSALQPQPCGKYVLGDECFSYLGKGKILYNEI